MGEGTRPGSQNPERDAKIARLRAAGLSYCEIGEIVDLSAERVGQILNKMKVDPTWLKQQEQRS